MDRVRGRIRRARKTRAKIAQLKMVRLAVHRTNSHIYAQLIAPQGDKVLATASSVEPEVRKHMPKGYNVAAAALIGKTLAERAKGLGIEHIAFDRSGYRYHGRIKALAEAARENGLKF
ncbi:MAG: 50S ribosomal protein L18 [Burkholderiales bacterium]